MDTGLNIVQLYDVNLIRSVMLHQDIFPTIIDDTWSGAVYTPDVDNEIFLGCLTDEGLIGVYRLHWLTGVTLQGHAHILKQFRKRHSKESCHAVMRWILQYVQRCQKIDCYAPSVYPNVKQFLAACGFTQEGTTRKSYLHKGALCDMAIMGITREEMEQVANV